MAAWKPLLALAIGLAAACASGGTAASDSPVEPAIQVQAAALEYVFQNNDSPLGFSAGSYCVGVGTGLLHSDPGPSLLRALREEIDLPNSTGYDCLLSRGAKGWQVDRCNPGFPRP